jgi:hypothetical protein
MGFLQLCRTVDLGFKVKLAPKYILHIGTDRPARTIGCPLQASSRFGVEVGRHLLSAAVGGGTVHGVPGVSCYGKRLGSVGYTPSGRFSASASAFLWALIRLRGRRGFAVSKCILWYRLFQGRIRQPPKFRFTVYATSREAVT